MRWSRTSTGRRCPPKSSCLSPPTRTTLAFVEVAEDGDREFTFYRSVPAADELLAPEGIKRETLSGASFVNFGSIPLIKDPVRSATRTFAELANEMDIPVAFDVNLREHLWESLETARKTIESMLDISTVVKLSDDELSPVLGAKNAEEAAKTLLGVAESPWCSSAWEAKELSMPPGGLGAACPLSRSKGS